jgi:Domain of unknown function (DUF4260)
VLAYAKENQMPVTSTITRPRPAPAADEARARRSAPDEPRGRRTSADEPRARRGFDRAPARRAAYAALAAALLGAALFVAFERDAGWWQFLAFGAMPDVALFLGIGAGLAEGRLHPRAVPLYNALHRFAGPLALAALTVVAPLPAGYLTGALAWGVHIAVDRAAGYGLRTPDGFQRS